MEDTSQITQGQTELCSLKTVQSFFLVFNPIKNGESRIWCPTVTHVSSSLLLRENKIKTRGFDKSHVVSCADNPHGFGIP